MSKGFAYTTFAILSAGLIVTIISLQVTNPYETGSSDGERIGEASFFLDSALSDMDRTLDMATRRALTGTTNYVVTEGEPLQNAEHNISEVLVNGSIDGENIEGTENASINEWNERVSGIAAGSGYSLDITLQNYTFEEEGMEIHSSFAVSAVLNDPVTLASFNQTESTETVTSIDNVEDPLLALRSEGRYISQYGDCRFEEPAEKVEEGEQSSQGSAKGEVAKDADTENEEEHIFVTENIDDYQPSEVENYAGIVSEESSSQSEDYNDNYVYGLDIASIEEDQILLLNEDQVWISWFSEMIDDCYVETETGPNTLDRFENRLTSSEEDRGLATFIDLSVLPEELQREDSAVDYVYFNNTEEYGDLNDIKEVSEEYTWFRLDDYHVEYWGLEDLTE